jgi:NTE family protein
MDLSDARTTEIKHFDCIAWHIALEDIQSIIPWTQTDGALQPRTLDDEAGIALYAYRASLSRVIKQLKTNYKLDGPENCSNAFLQDSLYDAAHIAVQEDKHSLDQVCALMQKAGLETGGKCKTSGRALMRPDYKIEPIQKPANLKIDEQFANRFVRCISDKERK